jgi:hypothetical protein
MVVDQTNQTVLLEEHMSEFKDHLRNKDEVIEGRDRVIQVRSCERVSRFEESLKDVHVTVLFDGSLWIIQGVPTKKTP